MMKGMYIHNLTIYEKKKKIAINVLHLEYKSGISIKEIVLNYLAHYLIGREKIRHNNAR